MIKIQIWIPLLLASLAGLSTAIGSFIVLFIKQMKQEYLRFSLGISAGVMVYVSFAELLRRAMIDVGFARANAAFFAGIALIMFIDFLVPHRYIEEHSKLEEGNRKLMHSGVFTALGVAIHNIPEGLVVFVSSLGGLKLGIALAFAVAIHNIPEGIAVAMPIYYATKSKRKAFWYATLSGMVEPIGAIIGLLILMPFISQALIGLSFAFAAGIMIFISFDELLPLAYTHEGNHITIAGIIIGMLVMAVSLALI